MRDEKEIQKAIFTLKTNKQKAHQQRLLAEGLEDMAGVIDNVAKEALADGGITALLWVLKGDDGPKIVRAFR